MKNKGNVMYGDLSFLKDNKFEVIGIFIFDDVVTLQLNNWIDG